MSKIEFFFLGALVGVVPMVSRFATLLVSSSQCLHLSASDHHVAFVQVTFATYWTTKLTLVNTLVQFDLVDHQIPKSKINRPRVHFPYSYGSPMAIETCVCRHMARQSRSQSFLLSAHNSVATPYVMIDWSSIQIASQLHMS